MLEKPRTSKIMKDWLNKISLNPYSVLVSYMGIAISLYYSIFTIGYISDDWGFVFQMEEFGWSAFSHNFTDKFYIPISHFLGTIQYQFTGGNPLLQHIIQVIIHGIIAWQIYMLCIDISNKTKNKDLRAIGLIAGLLFLINPFQVESVVWLASKSYGYTLFFSMLALRVLIQNKTSFHRNVLFWLIVFIAIHCKEWAYVLPFIAICLLSIVKIKIDKYFIIGLIITISISLGLRYLVLGTMIGGYENGQSFNIGVVSLHTLVYFLKFTTYIRFASTEFLPLPLVIFVSLLFICIFIIFLIKEKISRTTILYFFSLIILTLLPVAGLEITSFLANQSDRYSYFSLVPFSIIYAFVLVHLKKWIGLISITLISGIFIFFTVDYTNKWRNASSMQYSFLEELFKTVEDGTKVLLYNVPDTFNGIYCLRNGIEPFLKVNGKIVDIEIYQRQDFYAFESGSYLAQDGSFINEQASDTYTTYPKDIVSQNTISFNWHWQEEFDKTLIYFNTKFTPLSK